MKVSTGILEIKYDNTKTFPSHNITEEKNLEMRDVITFEKLPAAVTLLLEKVEAISTMLKNYSITPTDSGTTNLISINEAANYLNLSKATIYRLTSKRDIPHCKKGKRLYFSQKELNDWILSSQRKTNTENKAEALRILQKTNLTR